MIEVSRTEFYKTVASWKHVPHTQTDTWLRSMTNERNLRYYTDERQPATIACAGYVRRKAGMTMLCIGGECIRNEVSVKQIRDFYDNIGTLGFDIVEINLNSVYEPEYEVGLRLAGLLRPVGMFSTALSKVVDLTQPLTFDKSWKHNLSQCEANGLKFRVEAASQEAVERYMGMHNEMTARKHFDGALSEAQLKGLMSDPRFVMFMVEDSSGAAVAGRVVYAPENGRAVNLYSVTTPAGRRLHASYFLYINMFRYLSAQRGTPDFDLGRLAPSKRKKNDVFLFKNGIGGRLVQYNGEWLWCRRRWMPLMLYFMKKYVWKRVQV